MDQSDVFVLLGNVQYSSGVYQNRFRANDHWYTMKVNNHIELIKEKKYLKPQENWSRIKKIFPKLSLFDYAINESLWATNTNILIHAAMILGHNTSKIVHDYETHLKATDRLIDLCKTYGADVYLSGISGKLYLNEELFKMAGIELRYQDESKIDKRPLVELI
jgi:hypothetical protein